jgi:hypothetical protein
MKLFSLFLILSLFLFFAACRFKTASDEKGVSDSVPESEITLGGIFAEAIYFQTEQKVDRNQKETIVPAVLEKLKNQFERLKNEGVISPPADFMAEWRRQQQTVGSFFESMGENDLAAWVTLNEALLKYFGMVCFADELEKVFYNAQLPAIMNDSIIKPVCYTRRYDRIFVNLYTNSTLDFEHTTGGHVRLIQDTDYPNDGKVTLRFEVEDRRYIDLFIRIPQWAEIASVTAKGVKYPVYAGEYTEVATKWKTGDLVEVVLGMEPVLIENEKNEFGFTLGPLFLTYEPDSTARLVADETNPVEQLQLVSPPGKMPTFTFSGVPDHTLVLQPFYAGTNENERTVWIGKER